MCSKSCSAYAAKLISSTLKKNFVSTISQFTKTVKQETRTYYMLRQKLNLTTVDGKYWCSKPLMISTRCWSNFHAGRHHATCCSMQKLCRSYVILTSTLFSAFAVWQSCVLLHSAARHMWTHLKSSTLSKIWIL